MIRDAGSAGVHIRAAQFFRAHQFPGRCFDQRWPGQKDCALVPDDDRFIGHRRHIGPARGARSHHAGDLRNSGRRHVRLVVEDSSKMIAVRKHFVPGGKVRAAGIDQIDARQTVLLRDLLRPHVLFHRHRKIRAALHRGVVGNDDAFAPGYPTHAGNDAGGGNRTVVHVPCRKLRQLQKRRTDIQQVPDAAARQQLAAADVLLARRFAAALADEADLGTEVGYQRRHRLLTGLEIG